MKLSLILTVLDSHQALGRQFAHIHNIIRHDTELIVVDDGSDPPLELPDWVKPCYTHDRNPWTQPAARNAGARIAKGSLLLFFDVDQILTRELLEEAAEFSGDVLNWNRTAGCLSPSGLVFECKGPPLGPHLNSLAISRKAFDAVGGYDERFCGEYGYFDIDLLQRLKDRGFEPATAQASGMYWSEKMLPPCHSLPRTDSPRNAALLGAR